MFVACELTTRYVWMTVYEDVLGNIQNPLHILENLVRNQFNLLSDVFVIVTDFFYSDRYSVSFWFGDVFY